MSETLPAPAPSTEVTVEKRVQQYIQVRDAIAKQKEKDEEALKPLVELQNVLTGWLQSFLEQSGSESIRTKEGTCYSTTRYTASLADPDEFMKFVIANQSYDLLDRKANSTAVRDYVAEKGNLPPGVNLNSIKTVGVRRASGK